MRPGETGRAIAVTGGPGCGKSAVAQILRHDGVPVLDADDVARDVVAPGGGVLAAIAERFGGGVIGPGGVLDRRRLAGLVFGNAQALADLNALVHPPVRAAMRQWVDAQRSAGRACAGVIPLLYEVGADGEWDAVICVAAEDGISAARLRARGWTDEEIGRRRAAQLPLAEKRNRADVVIENDGTMELLAARVRAAWRDILEKESRNGR